MFAASDRPTVIYSSNKKLHYSNVNEDEVCCLHSKCQALLCCTTGDIHMLYLSCNNLSHLPGAVPIRTTWLGRIDEIALQGIRTS